MTGWPRGQAFVSSFRWSLPFADHPEMMRELAAIGAERDELRHDAAELPFRLVPRRANNFVNSSGRRIKTLTGGEPYNPAFPRGRVLTFSYRLDELTSTSNLPGQAGGRSQRESREKVSYENAGDRGEVVIRRQELGPMFHCACCNPHVIGRNRPTGAPQVCIDHRVASRRRFQKRHYACARTLQESMQLLFVGLPSRPCFESGQQLSQDCDRKQDLASTPHGGDDVRVPSFECGVGGGVEEDPAHLQSF